MPNRFLSLVFATALVPPVVLPPTHTQSQAQGQSSTQTETVAGGSGAGAARDSHEGMTIVVEPWTVASRYKEKFPKKSPFSYGIVAMQVTFKNESAESMQLDLKSVRLLLNISEDQRQELLPLSAEDVADTVALKNNGKDPTKRRNPLPIPAGKPLAGRDKNWTELRDTAQNASVPSNVVAAHSSLQGLVYFDLRGEVELLQSAHLYIPNLMTMSKHTPLSYFEIDLGRTGSN